MTDDAKAAARAKALRRMEPVLGAVVDIMQKERQHTARMIDDRLARFDENLLLRSVAADNAVANLKAIREFAEGLTLRRSRIVTRGQTPLPRSVEDLLE